MRRHILRVDQSGEGEKQDKDAHRKEWHDGIVARWSSKRMNEKWMKEAPVESRGHDSTDLVCMTFVVITLECGQWV